jgi:putative intracellular protease/amidase
VALVGEARERRDVREGEVAPLEERASPLHAKALAPGAGRHAVDAAKGAGHMHGMHAGLPSELANGGFRPGVRKALGDARQPARGARFTPLAPHEAREKLRPEGIGVEISVRSAPLRGPPKPREKPHDLASAKVDDGRLPGTRVEVLEVAEQVGVHFDVEDSAAVRAHPRDVRLSRRVIDGRPRGVVRVSDAGRLFGVGAVEREAEEGPFVRVRREVFPAAIGRLRQREPRRAGSRRRPAVKRAGRQQTSRRDDGRHARRIRRPDGHVSFVQDGPRTRHHVECMRKLVTASYVALLSLLANRAPADSGQRGSYTRNVAIVLYEGVELLDFAGPGEVFHAAGGFGAADGKDAFRVFTVAASHAPLTSQRFLQVTPEFSFADAPKADVIVIPGGNSSRLLENPEAMAWVKQAVPAAELTMTVCTGAFVLAKTGVTAGKDITTHFGALERLQAAVPDAHVQAGRRFVDNGTFVTTAGVSAGIDGSLHVVARLLGRAVADQTARYMEYHWVPEPYLSGKYALLNPSLDERGRSLQLAGIHANEGNPQEAAVIYKSLLAKDANDAGASFGLAWIDYRAERFSEAAEDFRRAAKKPDLHARATYNLACALARAGRRTEALDALEAALAAHAVTRGVAESDDDLASLRKEPRFATILASADAKTPPKS